MITFTLSYQRSHDEGFQYNNKILTLKHKLNTLTAFDPY